MSTATLHTNHGPIGLELFDEDAPRTGDGRPGYIFEDESDDHKIVRGTLAMASAGPDANGSQFFIVTAPATPWRDGKHTAFGQVTSGMEVVEAIEALPTDARDRPRAE